VSLAAGQTCVSGQAQSAYRNWRRFKSANQSSRLSSPDTDAYLSATFAGRRAALCIGVHIFLLKQHKGKGEGRQAHGAACSHHDAASLRAWGRFGRHVKSVLA